MFHVPAFNSDLKGQNPHAGTAAILSRRTTQTCTDTHMDKWRSLTELRWQRCSGRRGYELIPTDPSHMDQCLIFNCSETPINHPCVCVCVVVVAAASCLHISGMDPFTSCNMSLFIYTPEPVV